MVPLVRHSSWLGLGVKLGIQLRGREKDAGNQKKVYAVKGSNLKSRNYLVRFSKLRCTRGALFFEATAIVNVLGFEGTRLLLPSDRLCFCRKK